MRVSLIAAIALLTPAGCFSEHIEIYVRNLTADKGALLAVIGEKASTVDSSTPRADGKFIFTLSQRNAPGIYRLSVGASKWIDFVHDNEDVEIVSDARTLVDSLKVIHSESNRLFYAFRRLNQQYKRKSELLQLVLARYPKDDPYYQATQTTATQLQKQYSDFIDTASQARPASFIGRYIRSSQLPIVDLNKPLDQQLRHLKSHALDHVDFRDEGLIHSDVFTNKSIEYLTYYRNPQLPKELLEKEFNAAIDSILNRAKVNPNVYRHITEYLIDGFKKFGFENCINYILENYVIKDDLCLDQSSSSSIQRMIDQKKRLPIGALAPGITLPDSTGHAVSLDDFHAESVLILFYSSTCPHCQSMVPALSKSYPQLKAKGIDVLAISLDDSRDAWLTFLKANKFGWTDVYEQGGWSGKTASDYYVYATPTMILVDKEKRVASKPMTVDELMR